MIALSSCGENTPNDIKPGGLDTAYPMSREDANTIKRGRITGDDGISIIDGKVDMNNGLRPESISRGVNAYLWQAALDTISFMPISSVDATGGVILTDWYQDPNAKGEKLKANIVISSEELKASGVKVSLFRQQGGSSVPANAELARTLEDKILTRARELKIEDSRI